MSHLEVQALIEVLELKSPRLAVIGVLIDNSLSKGLSVDMKAYG